MKLYLWIIDFPVGEEKFLQQLHMEEQFGAVNVDSSQSKKKAAMGAAIGLNYDDPTAPVPQLPAAEATDENAETADGQAEDDDSDIDFGQFTWQSGFW